MDWYPTVLELCGIDPPKVTLDGHSVLPVVKDAKAASRHETLYFQWQNRWAVRQGDWKLIGTRNRKGEDRLTLHQLTGENPEKKNSAGEHPGLVKRLHSLHKTWRAGVTPGQK